MFFHFDLVELIKTWGYLGLFFIVFAESGLFFGFFLPGDSLLFTAGFLASQNFLNIIILLPLVVVGAITGDSVGYWMGRHFGNWLMRQKESFFFQKHHLYKAQSFYEKHGGKTIVLARFIPAIRTFAPIVAGMAKMEYKSFLTFNVFGGFLWGMGMTLLGFFLGSFIPGVDRYLLPIIALIIFLSILPGIYHFYTDRQKKPESAGGFSFLFRLKMLLSRLQGK